MEKSCATSNRVKLRDGRLLAYREEGVPREEAKYKIIHVHGFGSSKYSEFSASKELVKELGVYILFYDRCGYGESDSNAKRSMKSEVDDIEELADQLEMGPKFYLIGSSMGSYPTWGCLNHIPHRLSGVAFVAPAVNYLWPSIPEKLIKNDYRRVLIKWCLWISKHDHGMLDWWVIQKLFLAAFLVIASIQVYLNSHDNEAHKRTSHITMLNKDKVPERNDLDTLRGDLATCYGQWDFDPADLSISQESCVQIWRGKKENVVPVQLQRWIMEKHPLISYYEIPGGGHKIKDYDGICDLILRALLLGEEQNLGKSIRNCHQRSYPPRFRSTTLPRTKEMSYLVDEIAPILEENAAETRRMLVEYWAHVAKTEGFDLEDMPPVKWPYNNGFYNGGLMASHCDKKTPCSGLVILYARLGLHRYHFLQGKNMQLSFVKKFNYDAGSAASCYYITLVAKDPDECKDQNFQTSVDEDRFGKFDLASYIARPLGTKDPFVGCDHGAVLDDFYLGSLPELPPGNDFSDRNRFYIVKESELQVHDWIRLYLELAVATTDRSTVNHDLSDLKILEVAVETKEDVKPSKERLNAKNAVFYISYKGKPRNGNPANCIAIVRRTFDEREGCLNLVGSRTQYADNGALSQMQGQEIPVSRTV
ncbi:unnamed protein product [Microthlaspi erraticum]|uniref:Serine aminopeptidase S33 domain-containing protein n=1 Tax=Microthlaspi erraticum TaxID=1685480 RepID=A0A6D2IS97_9BRAS|nr:unnamed protein product [Microthlaspi erraticum]